MAWSCDRLAVSVAFLVLLGAVLPGCGGGGGGSGGSPPSGSMAVLEWDPPTQDAEGRPMDPRRDLAYYEFYLRQDRNFTDDDLPVAQVSAFFDILSPNGKSFTRTITKDFSLENLVPFVEGGKRYYLSIRAVGFDGLKSGFMVPVAWDTA